MRSTLENYLDRLHAIGNEEGLEAAMRFSGEELARFAETLHTAPEDSRPEAAGDFLVVARSHVGFLLQANMPVEAATTLAMAAATVIMEGVNPEKIAGVYLLTLQEAVMGVVDLMMRAQTDEVFDLIEPVAASLTALADATGDRYIGSLTTDRECQKRAGLIKELIQAEPTIFDRKVEPTMAADILVDAVARLKAFGSELDA